jgi:hypothetical protein
MRPASEVLARRATSRAKCLDCCGEEPDEVRKSAAAYREGVVAMSRRLGELATLRVQDNASGTPVFVKWNPYQSAIRPLFERRALRRRPFRRGRL